MRRTLAAFAFILTVCAHSAWATTLENPSPGAIKSGIGVVSGWVCEADELEISFDGGARQFVPYGSERLDTQGVCGDTDNGFGLLINYNNLGDGPHTATLYADGVVATQVNFNVKTLGTDFLRGVTGQGTVVLSDNKRVDIQWEETTQGFTITDYDTEGREPPDTTQPPSQAHAFDGTWDFQLAYFSGDSSCSHPPPATFWMTLTRSSLLSADNDVSFSFVVAENGQLEGTLLAVSEGYLISFSGLFTGRNGEGTWFNFDTCAGRWIAQKR